MDFISHAAGCGSGAGCHIRSDGRQVVCLVFQWEGEIMSNVWMVQSTFFPPPKHAHWPPDVESMLLCVLLSLQGNEAFETFLSPTAFSHRRLG